MVREASAESLFFPFAHVAMLAAAFGLRPAVAIEARALAKPKPKRA